MALLLSGAFVFHKNFLYIFMCIKFCVLVDKILILQKLLFFSPSSVLITLPNSNVIQTKFLFAFYY